MLSSQLRKLIRCLLTSYNKISQRSDVLPLQNDLNTFVKRPKKGGYLFSTASLPRPCQETWLLFSQKYPLITIADPINSQLSGQGKHNAINPLPPLSLHNKNYCYKLLPPIIIRAAILTCYKPESKDCIWKSTSCCQSGLTCFLLLLLLRSNLFHTSGSGKNLKMCLCALRQISDLRKSQNSEECLL